jgi:hypothetical protein
MRESCCLEKKRYRVQDETMQSYIWRWYWVSNFLSNSCLVSLNFSTRRREEMEFWLSFSRDVSNTDILFLISSCESRRSETSMLYNTKQWVICQSRMVTSAWASIGPLTLTLNWCYCVNSIKAPSTSPTLFIR